MSEAFGLDWLRLRESHDLRARSRDLARRFGAAARARAGAGVVSIVDLGAGSGANFRALAPLIPGDQDWRLVDADRALLAHQSAEIAQWARAQGWHVAHGSGIVTISSGAARWRAHSVALDLARDLEALSLGVHGVTCSAFLDLVSGAWLARLVRQIAAAGSPFLAALTVDGRRDWQPPHPDDATIARAFVRHQLGDKGFGPALGPGAAAEAERLLSARGHRVSTAAGEWRLGGDDAAMLAALIDGAVEAAAASDSALAVARWRGDRRAELRRGALALAVGHVDILAEPSESVIGQN